MIIRFSNKTEKEGFVVADKIVMDMNILREVVRHEDTVVFYDMDSAFSSLSDVSIWRNIPNRLSLPF